MAERVPSSPSMWGRITKYGRVQRVIATCIRGRSQQTRWLSDGRYLNVGCGYNIADGFINLDYQWRPGIDLCWDMRVALPFEDGSLDGIFCEHALEHVTADEGLAVLREFRRVLRPNGVARVVVPDAAIYLQAYCRYQRGQTFEIPLAPSPLPEGVTPLMATGRVFLDHGHRCAYDKETLENQMRRAGFANVQHKAYGVGLDPVLLIDTPRRAVESLYMDAQPSVADVG